MLSGTVYEDLNRDGTKQTDEPPLAGQQLYLYAGSGEYLGTTVTNAEGYYAFSGLADGDYVVKYDYVDWTELRRDWVPDTTGSVRPRAAFRLSGSATVDFGWRPIVRSTDLSAPISTYVGPSGIRTESFDDVVTAKEIYDVVTAGLIGEEAPSVLIRFDWGTNGSNTTTSVADVNGTYSGYAAIVYVNYLGWLDASDQELFHEYGHAWSFYYAYMVQQDPTLALYLKARGLDGDQRVNSSYYWSADEMIAEDYRQLFGSPNAQTASQMNRDIPPAKDVPGLRDFLATTFTKPPATPPPPAPAPAPALAVTGLSVTPTPVTSSATVSFGVSVEAAVTVKIVTKRGALVRTLLANATEPAGQVDVSWDRRNAKGKKVASGTYMAKVEAVDSASASVVATKSFSVS
jgi:hypothetical protein